MIQRVIELTMDTEGRLELQLIGGYSDEQNYSDDLFLKTINAFQSHCMQIHLTLACVGELNTIIRNSCSWPITYGAGVELKTGLFKSNYNYFAVDNLDHI